MLPSGKHRRNIDALISTNYTKLRDNNGSEASRETRLSQQLVHKIPQGMTHVPPIQRDHLPVVAPNKESFVTPYIWKGNRDDFR